MRAYLRRPLSYRSRTLIATPKANVTRQFHKKESRDNEIYNIKKFGVKFSKEGMTLKPSLVFNWVMFFFGGGGALVCNFKR